VDLAQLTNKQINRYARQISLKKIGVVGQKKLLSSKILIIGAGGLGSPISIYLAGMGIGHIGIVDHDIINISNIHRQILFQNSDIKKKKVSVAKKKLEKINPNIKIKPYNLKLDKFNIKKVAQSYEIIIDGSDNFKTRFLVNEYCIKNKKILISGAISKFDGHVYTFNFKKKNSPCLRCFMPNMPNDNRLDCELNGVMGSLGGIIGSIQANEVVKEILNIGESLCGYILIIDSLNLNFRKVKLNKNTKCKCNNYE